MSITRIIFIIAILTIVIIAVGALRGGGPRVTQIDRTVRRDKEDRE